MNDDELLALLEEDEDELDFLSSEEEETFVVEEATEVNEVEEVEDVPLTPTPAGIIRRFMSKVIQELDEERNELHLTDLTVECPRKLWFIKKDRLPLHDETFEGLLRMWQGKMLHKMPLTAMHELKLEYQGVKTSIDEYDPKTGTLIEKKFVEFVPKTHRELERYYSHYITQVQLEALFLTENGYEVKKAFLLFVKRGKPGDKPTINAFEVKVDLAKARRIFEENVTKAKEILAMDEPPEIPGHYTPYDYPCSYCSYRARCYLYS